MPGRSPIGLLFDQPMFFPLTLPAKPQEHLYLAGHPLHHWELQQITVNMKKIENIYGLTCYPIVDTSLQHNLEIC